MTLKARCWFFGIVLSLLASSALSEQSSSERAASPKRKEAVMNRTQLIAACRALAATSALRSPFIVGFSEDSKLARWQIAFSRPRGSTITREGRKPVMKLAELIGRTEPAWEIRSLHILQESFSSSSSPADAMAIADLLLWVRKEFPQMPEFECELTPIDRTRTKWRAELQAVPYAPDKSLDVLLIRRNDRYIVQRNLQAL